MTKCSFCSNTATKKVTWGNKSYIGKPICDYCDKKREEMRDDVTGSSKSIQVKSKRKRKYGGRRK